MQRKINIAIDGYSSSGKSTVAKELAHQLNYLYITSGAMYRAVAYHFINHHVDYIIASDVQQAMDQISIGFKKNEDTENLDIYLNGENIQEHIWSMEVSNLVSEISTIKNIREKVVKQQRLLGKDKGVVMDGRDIGTVVFPNAELKIFMTADKKIRASRRHQELMAKGIEVSIEEVMDNIEKRDHIDSTRMESPLTQAKDAILFDNSYLDQTEQVESLMDLVNDYFSTEEE